MQWLYWSIDFNPPCWNSTDHGLHRVVTTNCCIEGSSGTVHIKQAEWGAEKKMKHRVCSKAPGRKKHKGLWRNEEKQQQQIKLWELRRRNENKWKQKQEFSCASSNCHGKELQIFLHFSMEIKQLSWSCSVLFFREMTIAVSYLVKSWHWEELLSSLWLLFHSTARRLTLKYHHATFTEINSFALWELRCRDINVFIRKKIYIYGLDGLLWTAHGVLNHSWSPLPKQDQLSG